MFGNGKALGWVLGETRSPTCATYVPNCAAKTSLSIGQARRGSKKQALGVSNSIAAGNGDVSVGKEGGVRWAGTGKRDGGVRSEAVGGSDPVAFPEWRELKAVPANCERRTKEIGV